MKSKRMIIFSKIILSYLLTGRGIALLSFIAYWFTLAPGVFGFDSAELATGVHIGGIVHPTGYPLYMLVGKVFSWLPFGDLAYRLNLMSAVFGSLAIWVSFEIILKILNNKWFAAFGSIFLASSYYFWQMAIVAEVYTMHVFLLGLNFFLILKWREGGDFKYLSGFVFCYSLSLTNHTSGILFVPGFAWLVLNNKYWHWKKWRRLLLLLGLFVLGLLPYLYLPLRALANPSLNYIESYYNIDLTTWNGFWWMVSGRAYRFFAFGYSFEQGIREIWRFVGYLNRNFLGIGLVFGVAGIVRLWHKHRDITIGLAITIIGNIIFFSNYRVMDKDTMFLPSYFIWAILVAAGAHWLYEYINKLKLKSNDDYLIKSGINAILSIILVSSFVLNWQWVDLSGVTGPKEFAEEVMNLTEMDATVIADWSSAVVLEYYQIVMGFRTDLHIVNRSRVRVALYYQLWEMGYSREDIMPKLEIDDVLLINEELDQGLVYVIDYDPILAREFEYLPEGSFFQLTTKP